MKKYLLGLLAVPIMSPLLSLASAADYTFVEGEDGYTPSSFTTDGGEITNFVGNCDGGSCYFLIDGEAWTEGGYACQVPDVDETCNGKVLPAGTYTVSNDSDTAFSSVSFTIGSSSSGSSESVFPELSVPASFTSGITQLVDNFGSTISEWIPVVILVTLGVTAIFALFRVVRNYARRSFKG